jgi:streptogramin lyase
MKSLLLLLASVSSLSAAEWTLSTFAGTGEKGGSGDGGPATAAQIDNPFGVVRGPDGAIWFCEYTGQRIRRVAPDGTISTMAGTGAKGYSRRWRPSIAGHLQSAARDSASIKLWQQPTTSRT